MLSTGPWMKLFPGPMAVMTWFETEVAKAIKRGDQKLQWLHHQVLLSLRKL